MTSLYILALEVVRLIETVNHFDFFSVLLMLFLLAFLSIDYNAPVNLLMLEFIFVVVQGHSIFPGMRFRNWKIVLLLS